MPALTQPITTASGLGWLLQSERKAKKMTQASLARLVGVAQSRISHLEQHPEEMSLQQLLAWFSALGLELTAGRKNGASSTKAAPPSPSAW